MDKFYQLLAMVLAIFLGITTAKAMVLYNALEGLKVSIEMQQNEQNDLKKRLQDRVRVAEEMCIGTPRL